jgi:GntR family transcriptional regulator/MocR family aminotransferase
MNALEKKRRPSLKLYESIMSSIDSGNLSPGTKLQSTRDYARALGCNKLTVLKVLQNLVLEGWLVATERQSYQVSDKISLLRTEKKDIKVTPSPTIRVDVSLPDTTHEEEHEFKYKFVAGSPDLRCFPLDDFRSAIARSLRRMSDLEFGYSNPIGIPALVDAARNYFEKSRGFQDKRIVITNGTQEAIYILAMTLLKRGDAVVMESVGYPPVKRIFMSLGVKVYFVDVDNEGLQTAQLEKILKKERIKLVYLTPLHQYPTTITLSQRRRDQLKQLSLAYKFAILEDDYDHDFHYTKIPPKPISTDSSNTFYVTSLSKTMFPGLRLGFIVCHEAFIPAITEQKVLISRQNDCLSQIAVASWMRNGDFEKHLRRMRRIYEERYRFIKVTLDEWVEKFGISFEQPNGGLSFWVNIKRDADQFAAIAKRRGVFIVPESAYRFRGMESRHVRLGFSALNIEELEKGLQLLAQVFLRIKA